MNIFFESTWADDSSRVLSISEDCSKIARRRSDATYGFLKKKKSSLLLSLSPLNVPVILSKSIFLFMQGKMKYFFSSDFSLDFYKS